MSVAWNGPVAADSYHPGDLALEVMLRWSTICHGGSHVRDTHSGHVDEVIHLLLAKDIDSRADETVHAWRSEQLRRLGLTRLCAETVADGVDWHELAELIERGCSVELALEIVR